MAQGDIVIDANEINNATTWLEALRAVMMQLDNGDGTRMFNLSLSELKVAAGSEGTFVPGKDVALAINTMGDKVFKRTQGFTTNTGAMIDTLIAIAARSEQVETLNELAAKDFAPYDVTVTVTPTPPATTETDA